MNGKRHVLLVLSILATLLISLPAAAQPERSDGTRPRGDTGAEGQAAKPTAVPGSSAEALSETVPADWQSRTREEIAAREYDINWQDTTAPSGLRGSWQAPNRAHNFRTYFTGAGIRVVPRDEREPSWEWGLALLRYGRPGQEMSVKDARLSPQGNRVDCDRGGIVEWYVNDPRGLEQGFTLSAPPPVRSEGAASGAREVRIDLSLSGTLDPSFSGDAQAIDFKGRGGGVVLRYAQLRVEDARGRALPARMEGFAQAGVRGIRLVFADQDAVYPVTVDPLATSPAWTAESNQAGAAFGFSVATAGDVNGDGYSDVIIGAYAYDNGQPEEGRAYVYLGSASGLATSPAWTSESDQASALFGFPVATAGDVNGDGYSDVIVGAFSYDNGQVDEGRAYVFLGSVSGLAATPAWTAESDQAGAAFGVSVATAGDVNGDGYSDVIVGADFYDGGQPDEGRAFVYLGSASGLATSPAWTAESDQAGPRFGFSVATAGDVNGDGYSDVIVGAFSYDNGQADEGRAFVYLGSASGLATSPAWTAESDQASARFGFSVATAGDVNGDGYSDVIVGADLYDGGQTDEGRVYVYLGSAAAGLATSPAWRREISQAGASFGFSVATAGDVNGDGYSDVIVGAPLDDFGDTNEGFAYVFLGSAAGLATSPAWFAMSNQVGAQLGVSVATAGDVNGDGYSDVIVGANFYDNGQTDEGRAYVYLGSAADIAATPAWTAESDQASAFFAFSVATAGDVNGDGYSDVIVGAYAYDNGQTDEGRAYVYLGSASGLAATPAWTAESDQASALFGVSVATAGDVNGDGYSDVIVGAFSYDNGQVDEGRSYVYLGSASGLATSPAWTAESDQAGPRFGFSVATAGDVNGDGYSDVIVGADLYDHGQVDEGRAYVYLGSASGLATSPAWTAESDQAGAAFGGSVAKAGDVNRDGYSDVIVGAISYDNGQTNEGRAFVYLGSASGLATSAAWTAESDQAGAAFGGSVATAGDVNGDGYSDVIVGAELYDNGQTNEGQAFVYLGSAAGLGTSPAWFDMSNRVGAEFGISVATAGDVNGDGYSDVIVGAWLYDGVQPDQGRAFVYLGSASGLSSTYRWFAESDARVQAGASFGFSVATAGDVNGDGYSDVIVGAYFYDNGETNEGRAFVYYGNDGDGLDRAPRQARADGTAPIDLLGRSDSQTSFRLRTLGRTRAGRGPVRLEAEVKPLGTAFDGGGLVQGTLLDTGAPGVSGSAVGLDEVMAGLDPGRFYHWRLRVTTDSPFFPSSPWFSLPYNNRTETDLRTGGCRDADGDGRGAPPDPLCAAGAVGDCNDADSLSWFPPGEAQSLMLSHNPLTGVTTLTWLAPADAGGSAALVHDLLRAPDVHDFRTGATCVESNDGTNTAATDTAAPSVGGAFFYLPRAENGCPSPFGLGSLGSGSDGVPRTGRDCP